MNAIACTSSQPTLHSQYAQSRFVQRLQRRYSQDLPLLAPGLPTLASLQHTFVALYERYQGHAPALRVLRQLVMERLVQYDCDLDATLADITNSVTLLAEFTLDIACTQALHQLNSLHGNPITPKGELAQLWIVGMGKLGARELNVSSDIDLIYVYDFDGETTGTDDGRGQISNHEYFAKAIKIIYALIGETTEHGFVFRVDLALRPHGNSGPPAISLGALEHYLQSQGREWERFAWLKSRVVAPRQCIHMPSVQALRNVVLPFVFRRYLDYNVFEALRVLHQQIRDHAAKRSAGLPGKANDVKLSRGGIREIEFTTQLLQVVRGGQFPELRKRATLEALNRITNAGLMAPETAESMARAYTFLRRVEHRIQYLDDQQTHLLPTQDSDLDWIASTMGYAKVCHFLHDLDSHREFVAKEFDTLLGNSPNAICQSGSCGNRQIARATPQLDALLKTLPPQFRARVAAWRDHPRVQGLREEARARLMRLVERTAQWLHEGLVTEEAAIQLADWLETLLRRESYLALLVERPAVHERLLQLLGLAKWPARYMLKHPGVIDELASEGMLRERFMPAQFETELEQRLRALQATAEDDDETLLNLLRRAHHAEVFRTLARDVGQRISIEQVADDLSALADVILRVTARWCWQRLKNRHRPEPCIAIIGYGKLGGKELGYGSDLDIVFVFDDDDERAPEIYAAFVRKLINWLGVKTGEGDLFEIDTALRPNGNSGLLVTRFDAYANYQQKRGSNTAWTWEHQAMTRARCVLGSPDLTARFEAIRQAVICAPRDAASLRAEITAMRQRVQQAHPVGESKFDVKHSPGGMLDAEFAVQYLVLSSAAEHPELVGNMGNISLLQRAEAAQLLPAGVGEQAAQAYRELRRIQHRARLNEESTTIATELINTERNAILQLWEVVFNQNGASALSAARYP